MPRNTAGRALRAVICLALLAGALTPAAAANEARSGGASAPEPPEVTKVRCTQAKACARGQLLRVNGANLERVSAIVFKGGRGRADDRRTRPETRAAARLTVRVPAGARTGRLKVITPFAGAVKSKRVVIAKRATTPAAASPGPDGGVFPVRGAYDYGTETNRFGGGRNHQGQDVFAKCGTPIVAALAGSVTTVKWHDRAGHYVVIKAADGTSQAYMHLREAAVVKRGEAVAAGPRLGRVGATGRATGCHLHFELWTAPGWYEGGKPIDPLPALKRWAAAD